MGHELSYDNTSFHTQDFMEMHELLRYSSDGDVLGISNPQTSGVNQQQGWGQRVRVARGYGIGGQYNQPGHIH